MPAGRFAKPARVRGKLVPKSIKIDALAPGDEALHVGAAESEVPKERVLEDFLPRPDARKRRVDQHEARHAIAIPRGEGIPNHVADVMGHERSALDLERIEDAGNVGGLRLLVVTAGW